MRFFCRHGFGIHSPWAYSLVTNVLFDKHQYYAFSELKKLYPKDTKNNEQLFRLINALQPSDIIIIHDKNTYEKAEAAKQYAERASKAISIEMIEINEDTPLNTIYEKYPSHRVFSMINIITSNQSPSLAEWIINGHIDNKSCMVIEDIKKKNKPLWEKLLIIPEATATFDMSKRGIAFFDTKRFKQNYKL